MNWHTATVAAEDLVALLTDIRRVGGTVAGSKPCADGVRVTWAVGTPAGHRHAWARPTPPTP